MKKIAAVLSDAFYDDPMFIYSIPNQKRRKKHLHVLFEVMTKYVMKLGNVYTTSENIEGVMLTLPSNSIEISGWDYVKCGGLKIPFHLGFTFIRRILKLDNILRPRHKEIIPFPHLYLQNLGVAPLEQGNGHGGALLRQFIKNSKEQQLPCYLETANDANVSLYERFGFEVLEENKFPDLGFSVWLMHRKLD